MSAKYSVIQFVPDVITDERINIGVVAFNEDTVRVRFLGNWDRVRRFANQDIRFLQSFAREFERAASPDVLLPGVEEFPQLNEEFVRKMIQKSVNSIQLTESRASLKAVDELLNDTAARFLSDHFVVRRGYRDRRAAVSVAATRIRRALVEHLGNEEGAEHFLKSKSTLRGKFQPHTFDTVVANGVPYLAANGISFELPEGKGLKTHIDAFAWSIRDVHDRDPAFPIGVVVFPPTAEVEEHAKLAELYDQTIDVYQDLGAQILDENNVESWAETVVKKIPIG
jgi:hypothetical protein